MRHSKLHGPVAEDFAKSKGYISEDHYYSQEAVGGSVGYGVRFLASFKSHTSRPFAASNRPVAGPSGRWRSDHYSQQSIEGPSINCCE